MLATTLQPGRDLRAGLVHVEHLRPLPLPVRHHRGGGGAGQPAGFLHADADDERAPAARQARHDGARTAGSRSGLLRAASTALTPRCLRLRHAPSAALVPWWRSLVIAVLGPALPAGPPGIHPERRRRRRVRRRVTAPEGTASPRWTRRCTPIEDELRGDAAACRPCWRPPAAASSARQHRQHLRAHRAARGADRSRSAGCCAHRCTGDPLAAFHGNLRQQRRHAAGPRAGCASIPDLRIASATSRRFNIGGGNFDIDFTIRGPDLSKLARLRRAAAAARQMRSGCMRRRHHAEARQTRDCASRSTANAPPTWASTSSDIGTALRLMVGGDDAGHPLPRSARSTRTTTCSCAWPRATAATPDDLAGSTCRGRGGGSVALDNLVTLEPGPDRLAHRPARPPAAGVAPRRVAPGYALADRLEALRQAVAEHEPAAGLHHAICGRGPRAGAHVPRVHLGVPAVGRLHVHDPGVAVREPGPPADDPALAAAVACRSRCSRSGHRRHAQPVLGAGHAGAVRRGEEERDPADRSHEPAARAGHASATTRSSRPTATACGRS